MLQLWPFRSPAFWSPTRGVGLVFVSVVRAAVEHQDLAVFKIRKLIYFGLIEIGTPPMLPSNGGQQLQDQAGGTEARCPIVIQGINA